jgi:hypothetical protein
VAEVEEIDHHRGAEAEVAVVDIPQIEGAEATGAVGDGDRGAGGGAGRRHVARGLGADGGDRDRARRRRQPRRLVRTDRAAAAAGQRVQIEGRVQRMWARPGRRVDHTAITVAATAVAAAGDQGREHRDRDERAHRAMVPRPRPG